MKHTCMMAIMALVAGISPAFAKGDVLPLRTIPAVIVEASHPQQAALPATLPTPEELESVFVKPAKVVERSKFDGQKQVKPKTISEAIAEQRGTPSKTPQHIASLKPSRKPTAPERKADAKKGKTVEADDEDEVASIQPKVIRITSQKPTEAPQLAAKEDDKRQFTRVTTPVPTITNKSGKAPPMIALTPDSYLIPPNASPQQLAMIAPAAAAPTAPKALPSAKVTTSLFTGTMAGRNPQDRLARAPIALGNVTYFSIVENLQGQYLVHRWEKDGKVMFDKPFAVNATPSSAWSTVELSPGMVGTLGVKVMDQQGRVLSEERIEVTP